MSKPFKFQYVNTLVGAFIILTIGAAVVGIALAGRAQNWGAEELSFKIKLPPESTYSLQEGAEVQILGTVVGSVAEIHASDDGEIWALLSVVGDFTKLVRVDSIAKIKKKMVVFGDTYIEVSKGSGKQIVKDEWLPREAERDTEVLRLAEDMIEDVRQKIVSTAEKLINEKIGPLIDSVQSLSNEYRGLATDIRETDTIKNVNLLVKNLTDMSEELRDGSAHLNKLLHDPETTKNLQGTLSSLRESVQRLQNILGHVDGTLKEFPPMARVIRGEVEDMPGFIYQTTRSLQEAENLLKDLQDNWFIGGSSEKPEEPRRIAPQRIEGGESK